MTLNSDEENATAHAVLVPSTEVLTQIFFVSPNPDISRIAVDLAARRLKLDIPTNIQYSALSYWSLLRQYRQAATTYSTHVLLPGRDFSKQRRHVHLTHGSGPKPDSTFRAPTNVLASITPLWVTNQLREYRLPPDTEIIEYMPRLEIMRRSVGDRRILERLGLDPLRPLVVWAPTYRKSKRGKEILVSGHPFDVLPKHVAREAERLNATLALKVHPHDVENYASLNMLTFTNQSLRDNLTTPYELFGVANLVVTDFSSIGIEREALGLACSWFRPDSESFATSVRGLRGYHA